MEETMQNKSFCILALAVILVALSAGCIDEATKVQALDAISPVVVLKGSTQYCNAYPDRCSNVTVGVEETTAAVVDPITAANLTGPLSDADKARIISSLNNTTTNVTESVTDAPIEPAAPVTTEPTINAHYIDPYAGGERWESQWYRWHWDNVSGLQQVDRGIIVYGHKYYNILTYWDDAWGNYFEIYPDYGMRFLAVFVHEEDFNEDNSGIWAYDNTSFKLQYDGQLHDAYSEYNPVYRISTIEDSNGDYYGIEWIKPFGLKRVYGGMADASTGGYHVEEQWSLWSGPGNAWDGYILYQVPETATDSDIRIVGNFATQNVNWRFDSQNQQRKYPASYVGTPATLDTPAVTPTPDGARV